MTWQTIFIYAGLAVTAGVLLFTLAFFGYAVYRYFRSSATPFRVGVSRMIVLSGAILLMVFGVRTATCTHAVLFEEGERGVLSALQTTGEGLLRALQTFSMDEDYQDSVIRGKNLVLDLSDGTLGTMEYDEKDESVRIEYGEESVEGTDALFEAYGKTAVTAAFLSGLFFTVLNCAAPISGGAVIFQILAAVFPKIRLWLLGFRVWRKKIYFSELNDRSLELMKSIYGETTSFFDRPVVIFTDAYAAESDEHSYELLEEARVYGAICVKDDLSNVRKCTKGKRLYFLIDDAEEGNLKTLVDLSAPQNRKAIRGAKIYVFTQNDDTYVQVERRVRTVLAASPIFKEDAQKTENKRAKESKRKMPAIVPVQSYRNLVTNLFDSVPLYEPLTGKKGVRDLHLTVIGCGEIGMETVLAAYWYGQILDCRLHINVISKEDDATFESRLDYVNPEIRRAAAAGDPILRYGEDAAMISPAYCTLNYVKSDVKAGEFCEFAEKKGDDPEKNGCAEEQKDDIQIRRRINAALEQTDYFVVALGSDEDNVAIAEKLRRYVSTLHLREKDACRTVIAYAVYCSELAKTLNARRCYGGKNKEQPDVYMYAFGGLDQVYSTENIFMTRSGVLAKGVGEAYTLSQRNADLEYDHGAGRMPKKKTPGTVEYDEEYETGYYNQWADLARAFHMKYKVFSMGWITTSLFDDMNEDKSKHGSAVTSACARYKRVAEYQNAKRIAENDEGVGTELPADLGVLEDNEQYEQVRHRLAWLEHRRWVAFTRVRGFRNTDDYASYMDVTQDHKNMSLKLHPCLREYGVITGDSHGEKTSASDGFDKMEKDVNEKREKRKLGRRDFREYDYIVGEFPFEKRR